MTAILRLKVDRGLRILCVSFLQDILAISGLFKLAIRAWRGEQGPVDPPTLRLFTKGISAYVVKLAKRDSAIRSALLELEGTESNGDFVDVMRFLEGFLTVTMEEINGELKLTPDFPISASEKRKLRSLYDSASIENNPRVKFSPDQLTYLRSLAQEIEHAVGEEAEAMNEPEEFGRKFLEEVMRYDTGNEFAAGFCKLLGIKQRPYK